MIIGSHVSMSAPDFLLGSAKETIAYKANAMMIYSGAPQNTFRQPISKLKIDEFHKCLHENNIPIENVIVHAPYIINLANSIKPETFELAVDFLKQEINRVKNIGAKYLVLHPGSHVKAGEDIGLKQIVDGLNQAMSEDDNVYIALETMAGKGSELGYNFEQLKYIIDNAKYNQLLKICMDTCHMNDAGYDVSNFDQLLDNFNKVIGIERLACIHLNDSKNTKGAKKDRHANIGHGEIGFETLRNIALNNRTSNICKILETPFVNGKPPYKEEIEMLQSGNFIDITGIEEN